MPTYLIKSTELKTEFKALQLLPHACLFTADAVSMYTNINTEVALFEISAFLCVNKNIYRDISTDALITELGIVMRNNVFTLGNTTWKQGTSAAMGKPLSPLYATLYFGIHEIRILKRFPTALISHNQR